MLQPYNSRMREFNVVGWTLDDVVELLKEEGFTEFNIPDREVIPYKLQFDRLTAWLITDEGEKMLIAYKKVEQPKSISLEASEFEWFMIDFLTPTKIKINGKVKEYEEGDFITLRKNAEIEVIEGHIKITKHERVKVIETIELGGE